MNAEIPYEARPFGDRCVRADYSYWQGGKEHADPIGRLYYYLYEEVFARDARLHAFLPKAPGLIASLARDDAALWERTRADELVIITKLMPPPPPAPEPEPKPERRTYSLWQGVNRPGGSAPDCGPDSAWMRDLVASDRLLAAREKRLTPKALPGRRQTRELIVERPTLRKELEQESRRGWGLVKDALPSRAHGVSTARATLNPAAFSPQARHRWEQFLGLVREEAARDATWWRSTGFLSLEVGTTTRGAPRPSATEFGFIPRSPWAPSSNGKTMAPIGFTR